MSLYPPDWKPPQEPPQPYTGYASEPQWTPHSPSQPLPPQQYTQYPQQGYGQQPLLQHQPEMYPPQQPPKERSRTWLWIVLGVVAVLLIGCVATGAAATNATKMVVATATATTQLIQNQSAAITAPQPTDMPTHTPTPTSQHFKQTEAVQVPGYWDIEILSVKESVGSELNKPQNSGDVFLIFIVKVKNISSDQQYLISAQFPLLDSAYHQYQNTIDSDAPASLDGQVNSNSTVQGSIVYEVPANLHAFTLGFMSQGQVVWDIQV